MYASKNGVVDSAIDAVGMGIGFTLALFLMASIREILGAGSFFGIEIPWLIDNPILIFGMAPGGFFVFGCLIALVNKISKKKNNKEFGCHNCPSAYLCGKKDENPCATVGEGDDK
jgi:electron transport complex protein RnfE